MGEPNVGKTSLINTFLSVDSAIPVSPICSHTTFEVNYSDKTKFSLDGKTIDIKAYHNETENIKNVCVEINNKWLKDNNICLIERFEKIFTNKTTEFEYADFFSDFEIAIYVVNALMPITKNDMTILSVLDRFEIPTFVVVSNYEKCSDENKNEVSNYVIDKFGKFSQIKGINLESRKTIFEVNDIIIANINSLLNNFDYKKQRNGLIKLFFIEAISQLQKYCQDKLTDCDVATKQLNENAQDKTNKMDNLYPEWMHIELQLNERRQKTENKIKDRLDSKKVDMIRILSHDIDICGDVKAYYEKQLPFRMNEMMRSEVQSLTRIFNNEIYNCLKWLQDEILKTFKTKIGQSPIMSFSIENNPVDIDVIDIKDNKKIKYVVRFGSVATVITAGALISTAGIGGAVMAVSMLTGIGAEIIMGRKNKIDKQKVQEMLPNIIEKYQLSTVLNISNALKNKYDEIIDKMKIYQLEWKEKTLESIENEKNVAVSNLSAEKWKKHIENIEQITKENL